jgi:DNA-binding MarR family transcriptional regulator
MVVDMKAQAAAREREVVIDYGQLNKHVGYVLRRAQMAIFQDFIAAFEAVDLRPAQYSILTVIEANPGLRQSQVAEALGIKKTNFVAMIETLERRDLVRREPPDSDRRVLELRLSDAGAALMPRLHAIAAAHERRVIARLGVKAHQALFAPLAAIAGLGEAGE